MTPNEHNSEVSERQAHAEATYQRLFGPRDQSAPDNDPELMEILRRFIFGDVFDTGVLDDQTRELITVTVLACLQTLPQLKSHAAAALNVGVQPIEIREAIYQLAPFIGFPRTLNAVATVNEVFRGQDIALPLPVQGTVSDNDRYPKGQAEQAPLYGEEIKDNMADLPQPFNELLPRFLTEFCFGDFYTRGGLSLSQRELLVLCGLSRDRRHLGPARPPWPRVHPGGQLQDCRGSRARTLLPLHRIPARRRGHPGGQEPVVTSRSALTHDICFVTP